MIMSMGRYRVFPSSSACRWKYIRDPPPFGDPGWTHPFRPCARFLDSRWTRRTYRFYHDAFCCVCAQDFDQKQCPDHHDHGRLLSGNSFYSWYTLREKKRNNWKNFNPAEELNPAPFGILVWIQDFSYVLACVDHNINS